MLLSEKFRSFEEDIQTLYLPSIDSDRLEERSSLIFFFSDIEQIYNRTDKISQEL